MNGLFLALALAMTQPWGTLNLGERITVNGLPTFGKTTLCEKLAAEAYAAIFLSTFRDFEKPSRGVATVDQLERYPQLLAQSYSRIAVRVTSGKRGRALADEYARTIECVNFAGRHFDRTGKGGRIFVLDEIGDVRRHLEDELNAVFRGGRHYGIVPVFASQVATDLPLKARKLASTAYFLGQRHNDELKEIAACYGRDFASRVGRWRKYEPPIVWLAENPTEGI